MAGGPLPGGDALTIKGKAPYLSPEMAARRLNILEYVQETLARRYEALRDDAPDRGRRR